MEGNLPDSTFYCILIRKGLWVSIRAPIVVNMCILGSPPVESGQKIIRTFHIFWKEIKFIPAVRNEIIIG